MATAVNALRLGEKYAAKRMLRVIVRRWIGLGLPLPSGSGTVGRMIWDLKHWGSCQFLEVRKPFVSQYGQDIVVSELMEDRSGTFLDVGAFDGISFSNSYYLEKHLGWKGVCVEPNPLQFPRLRESRSCICEQVAVVACATDDMEFTVLAGEGAMLSGLCGTVSDEKASRIEQLMEDGKTHTQKVKVSCRTVPEILRNASLPTVDFISFHLISREVNWRSSILSITTNWEPV